MKIRHNNQDIVVNENINVIFHNNGNINQAYLKDIQKIKHNTQDIEFGFFISFYENGNVNQAHLKHAEENDRADESKYHNILYKTKTIWFKDNTKIIFYKNGNISKGILHMNVDIEVKGKMINFKDNSPISFYEDGNVKQGIVSRNQDIQGRRKYQNETIYFDEKGNLK